MIESYSGHRQIWDKVAGLPPDVLVANYHVGRDWINLFVIRSGALHTYRIAFRASELPPFPNLLYDRSRGLVGGTPSNWPLKAHRLIDPVLEHSKDCSVIYLVPHGLLEHYPLHALGTDRRLLQIAPVMYLPCLSLLRHNEPIPAPPWRALVMGNMTGELPGAEREADAIAGLLGTKAYLSLIHI